MRSMKDLFGPLGAEGVSARRPRRNAGKKKQSGRNAAPEVPDEPSLAHEAAEATSQGENMPSAMTWEEIDMDWARLQKRQRTEIAEAVARYCIGHKMEEVATRLGFSVEWTRQQLNYAGIVAAVGEGPKLLTPEDKSDGKGVDHAVSALVKQFAPQVTIKLEGQAGEQSVAAVEGDDAEEFEPYFNHYLEEGHEPAAATRLAKAEWAGKKALGAGAIEEDTNKKNEKVNRILSATDPAKRSELEFNRHMERVKAASCFLEESKTSFLRRKSTCEMVTSVHDEWREQVERISNYHPTFEGD
jgi:hypothetical protein